MIAMECIFLVMKTRVQFFQKKLKNKAETKAKKEQKRQKKRKNVPKPTKD